jgi:hypothetical protein
VHTQRFGCVHCRNAESDMADIAVCREILIGEDDPPREDTHETTFGKIKPPRSRLGAAGVSRFLSDLNLTGEIPKRAHAVPPNAVFTAGCKNFERREL